MVAATSRLWAARASMQATTATWLAGGSGNGPLNWAA
jgi:hypothetical protein